MRRSAIEGEGRRARHEQSDQCLLAMLPKLTRPAWRPSSQEISGFSASCDRIVYSRAPLRRQHVAIHAVTMSYVEIVAMYGGADGQLIKAAVGWLVLKRTPGPSTHTHTRRPYHTAIPEAELFRQVWSQGRIADAIS